MTVTGISEERQEQSIKAGKRVNGMMGNGVHSREVNTRVMVTSGDDQGNHRGQIHYRVPPPPPVDRLRRQPMPGSSTRTRGRFVWMGPMKFSGK